MNLQNDPHSLALMKFGIGQPVRRTEDPTLVRGAGRYTDDVKLPNEAHAVLVRSRVAHGHEHVAFRRIRKRGDFGEPLLQLAANVAQALVHLRGELGRLSVIRRLQRAPRRVVRVHDDHTERNDGQKKAREDERGADLHSGLR